MKISLLYLILSVALFSCQRATDDGDKGSGGAQLGEPITSISMDIQSSPESRVGVDIDPTRQQPEKYFWTVDDALILCELNDAGTKFTGNNYQYIIKDVPIKGEKANFIGAKAVTTGKYIVLHTRRWGNVTLPTAGSDIGFKIPRLEQTAEIAGTIPNPAAIQKYADNLFFSTAMVTGEQLLTGNAELKHQLTIIEVRITGEPADTGKRIRRVELQPEVTNGYASSMTLDVQGNATTIGGGIPTTYVTDPTAKLDYNTSYKVRILARPTSLTENNGGKFVVHCGMQYSQPTDANPTKTFTLGNISVTSRQVGLVDIPEPMPATPLPNPYVGAFWRNDQMGERLIYIQANTSTTEGDWTATVAWTSDNWSEDDIIILQEPKPTITDQLFDDSKPDTPPVLAQSSMAAGTTTSSSNNLYDIFFKIGLKSKHTPAPTDDQVRYAVILLTYNDNTKNHYIYLRQGEAPSIIGTGTTTLWSAYNLGNSGTPAPFNNGGFVRFPSQAGYFKKASTSTKMYPPTSTGFVRNDWNADKTYTAIASVCPTGYRIPTCHSASATSGDDMHSLFVVGTNAKSGDLIRGTYADGYYDRTNNSSSYEPNPDYAGYAGQIVVNTSTYASVFFPTPGFRAATTTGSITSGTAIGGYWSSSSWATGKTYMSLLVSSTSGILELKRASAAAGLGYNIRCVK